MVWWQSLGLPGAELDKGSIKFPFELELVPDVLKASVSLNTFIIGEDEHVCWTYCSHGLSKAGQKEIVISIVKDPEEKNSDFPQAPMELFKTILQHALHQEYIDIGSISDFGENGFLSARFPGAAYVRSQAIGDWFPPENSLSCLLLTAEELAASQIAGLTRVMALLGKTYLHYPCPVWNQLKRESVITEAKLKLMSESFIAQMPRILIRDSGSSARDRVIDLQLPLSARHYFKQLEQLDSDSPLLIISEFDERSDAILVYQDERKNAPLAISAPGTQGTRIAGSFVCFAPSQESDHGMIIEDGFAISIRKQSWEELRQSLLNGSPFYLSRQEEGYDFRLSWHQDEEKAISPNTIQLSGADLGCRSGASEEACAEGSSVPAYATEINLLSHEKEIKELLGADLLKRYIEHIEDVIRDHFLCMGESEGFDLSVTCTILPERKAEFEVKSNPVIEADDEKDLLDRLEITYAPEIVGTGKIKFSMQLLVWGGKRNEA
ncbi:MAG: DUF3480 domain-containing protein [Candidatus Obscuribacterales bacterium]|nr:DUF3480 domain-containing protein [Candidatus Obscuribacterales bacterium]